MDQPRVLGASAVTARLESFANGVRAYEASESDLDLLAQLRTLEELVCAAQAAQARATKAFVASRREQADRARDDDRAAGIGPRVADRRRRQAEAAITAEVAIARRVSPHRAARQIGLTHALSEMSHAQAAFDAGDLTEWKVTLLARETACLTREDRAIVDTEIAQQRGGVGALGERKLEAVAKKIAYRLDPHAATRRAARAFADRHVSLRPAPDTMTWLTTLLPVKDGVACHVALSASADEARAAGDERTRGQVMADILVDRLTGRASAPTESPRSVTWPEVDTAAVAQALGPTDDDRPTVIELNLVMTDSALFGADDEPAHVAGHGPLPAPLTRAWVADPRTRVFLRRLYTRPTDGALVAMDSRARLFDDGLRRLITLRDDVCRTPWCEAPIRHVDHVTDHTDGGPTSAANGQGLCERCNYAKQAPGWSSVAIGDSVSTATPAGWGYTTFPPPLVDVTNTTRSSRRCDGEPPPPPDHPPEIPAWLGPDGMADCILAC